jgi:hypothetical protein
VPYTDDDDIPLFAPTPKVYPQKVSGTYRRIKWGLLIVGMAIYYLLPFVRWDRGPNLPDQAVLVDFERRRFYFFFIELWPQEVYYFTGLLILAAIILFLMNALAGRIWCGYLCPQTVWTDLFLRVERFFEGDRRDRIKLDDAPWTADKVGPQGRQALCLADDRLVDRWGLGALLRRRANAGARSRHLAGPVHRLSVDRHPHHHHLHPRRPPARAGLPAHVPMAAHPGRADRRARPQRLVSLRSRRAAHVGQGRQACPRGGAAGRRLHRLPPVRGGLPDRRGHPPGLATRLHPVRSVHRRLRHGDDQDRRPTRLIAYDTDEAIKAREVGQTPTYKPVRARTILYAAIIALVGGAMIYQLATRAFLGMSLIHDRTPLFVTLRDGSIRNAYTVRLINKRSESRQVALTIDGPTSVAWRCRAQRRPATGGRSSPSIRTRHGRSGCS